MGKTINQRIKSIHRLTEKLEKEKGILQTLKDKGYCKTDDQIEKKIRAIEGDIERIEQGIYHRTKRQFETKHPEKYQWKEISRNNSSAVKKLKTWKTRGKGGTK